MNLIKNTTPYLGKIKLRFERHPHYTSSKAGKLNKIHLDLGFTKLVSRMIPAYSGKDGKISVSIDPVKVALIEKFTGGLIKKYEWWEVKGSEGVFRSLEKPKNKKDIIYHGCLENSFVSKSGVYIGNIDSAWWYYKNRLIVCEEYPLGVAKKLTERTYKNLRAFPEVEGYYGYSHRGGCLFKIGDRVFDENYQPTKEDYSDEQWEEWTSKYNKGLKKADEFDKEWVYADGVKSIIPFNLRGKKIIKTLDDAIEAATNLSKYLS